MSAKPDRKQHARSWIKNLPFDAEEAARLGRNEQCTQQAIRDLLAADGATLDSVAALCLSRFASEGCDQTPSGLRNSLSEWRPWFDQKRANTMALSQIRQQVEMLAGEAGGLTPEQMDAMTRSIFKTRALAADDPETFLAADKNSLTARAIALKAEGDTRKAKQKDHELKLAARRAETAEQALALEREKWVVICCEKILAAATDAKAQAIAADSGLSNGEKIARLRQTYFADIDALQASGKVVLP